MKNDLMMGIHQMSKSDRKFDEKRMERIEQIYKKDKLRQEMKEDGFTYFDWGHLTDKHIKR